jgi:hypothetical protein
MSLASSPPCSMLLICAQSSSNLMSPVVFVVLHKAAVGVGDQACLCEFHIKEQRRNSHFVCERTLQDVRLQASQWYRENVLCLHRMISRQETQPTIEIRLKAERHLNGWDASSKNQASWYHCNWRILPTKWLGGGDASHWQYRARIYRKHS